MARGPEKQPGPEPGTPLGRPRRRDLPVAPLAPPALRDVPLCDEVRPVDRVVRPNYAVWETTLQCDQACRHCGSRAGRERVDELTLEERIDLIGQLAALGVLEVTLTGGETYLRDDWLEVIRQVRAHGMECTMVTAGRGVTAGSAAEAAAAGLQAVSVSLDGRRATHDRLRSWTGAHDAAVSALGHFRAAGVPIAVNTQINRLSLSELPSVLDAILELGVYAWQLQLTIAMGRASDEHELLLQPYDILELFEQIPSLVGRCREASVLFWPADSIGYFGPHETLLRGAFPRGHWSSCGAGRGALGIEADGVIKGCASLATAAWNGGSIRDRSLEEIWQRSARMRFARERRVEDLWGYCRSCYYAETCMAGCTATSFVLFGRTGNNPYCHHRALDMRRNGKRERLVPGPQAPGTPFDWRTFELVVEDDRGGEAPAV